MNYDLNKYRKTIKPLVEYYLAQYPTHTLTATLSTLALTSQCPIVCVGYFIEEIKGPSEELTKKIQQLEHYYKVEKIEGKLK